MTLIPFHRLRLGLSHLSERRFRHIFKHCINSLCSCSLEAENTLHIFLHYLHYSTFRMDFMNKVNQIDENVSNLSGYIIKSPSLLSLKIR